VALCAATAVVVLIRRSAHASIAQAATKSIAEVETA
jgi:hypothetical protein